MPLTLTLGPVEFSDFEIPEKIGNLGGTHLVATHRFPGGYQSQQTFGGFPDPITWAGIFTGTTAMYRKNVVDRLRVSGQEVALAYGDKLLVGVVSECRIEPKHQWLIPYSITFTPRLDISSGAGPSDALVAIDEINRILQSLNNLIAFFSLIAADDSAFPTPPQLQAPMVTLFATTSQAVSASYGVISDIPPSSAAAIYAAANALLAAAQPLVASTNPAVSSPAIDISGYAGSIANLVRSSQNTQTTVQAVNPNLMTVAAQYYGDATKWRQIAAASNISPPDPLPIGQFTLVVPNVTQRQATV